MATTVNIPAASSVLLKKNADGSTSLTVDPIDVTTSAPTPAKIASTDDTPAPVVAGTVARTTMTNDIETPAEFSATLTTNALNTATPTVDFNPNIVLEFFNSLGTKLASLTVQIGQAFTGPVGCKTMDYVVTIPNSTDGGRLDLQLTGVSGGLIQPTSESHTRIDIAAPTNSAKAKLGVNYHDYEQAPNGSTSVNIAVAQSMKAVGVQWVRLFRDSIWGGRGGAQDQGLLAFCREYKTNNPSGKLIFCLGLDPTAYANLGTSPSQQAACAAAAWDTAGNRSMKWVMDYFVDASGKQLIDILEGDNEPQLSGGQDPNSLTSNNGAGAMAAVYNILIPQAIAYAATKGHSYGFLPPSTIENTPVPLAKAVDFSNNCYSLANSQVRNAYIGRNFHKYDYDDTDGTNFQNGMTTLLNGTAGVWGGKPAYFTESGPPTSSVAPDGHSLVYTPDMQRDLTLAQINIVKNYSSVVALTFYVWHNKGAAKPNDGNSENNYGWLYGDLTNKPVSSGSTMLTALTALT